MEEKELGKYRRILIAMKREIENALDGLSEIANNPNTTDSHYPDDPSYLSADEYEKVKSINIMNVDQSILELVDNALTKIENGKYGICELCGKVIEKGRLKAKPHSRYCVSCREKLEKEGKV
jgi:DnaK suppressor protein